MFLNNPILNIYYDKDKKETLVITKETLRWNDSNNYIEIHSLFISDGASIPMQAWGIVGHPLTGQNIRPALMHDWECKQGQKLKDKQDKYPFTWQEVHERFRQALISEGVPKWKANIMHDTVYARWKIDKTVRW